MVSIRDLNSLNGTWVNGELVVDDRILRDGDVIALGDATLVYHEDCEVVNRPVSAAD